MTETNKYTKEYIENCIKNKLIDNLKKKIKHQKIFILIILTIGLIIFAIKFGHLIKPF